VAKPLTPPTLYTRADFESVLRQVYLYSERQDYRGHDKHDALNSPIVWGLYGFAKWPRILATQLVMRSPVDLRQLLRVPRVYNPKGLALFAQGLLDWYRVDRDPRHLEQADHLLHLLDGLRAKGRWHGHCWGYQYPWQDLGFFAPRGTPNAVVTSFVAEAFLDAFVVTGERRYLETVAKIFAFYERDLQILKDTEDELCLSYMPLPMTMRVMDVSILIGSVLARYSALTQDDRWLPTAQRLVGYVVHRQTEQGAWFYTDPPGDSPIRHDNYHTGFILDALWRYMVAVDEWEWEANYRLGLHFYASHHFTREGAPCWMSDVEYPYDIHGAAQGILTFSRHRAEYPGLAERIASWAIREMYHFDGRFFYQKTRFGTKRFCFLRWCNGWMARALARLLLESKP
jgi:hypothetical protein